MATITDTTESGISAYLVNGFLDSGKTTYIQDCLKNDFFYKRGRTLIISFEEGEKEYDEEILSSRKTDLVYYSGSGELAAFVRDKLAQYRPDRVYVEMNAMIPGLYEVLSHQLLIRFSITLIEGSTFSLYLTNMRQMLMDMVRISHQVIFNRIEKEILAPYGNLFRITNDKAVYLWEGPTGYHEKAFGVMVPYDLKTNRLTLADSDFTPFYLDTLAAPEHYEGKELNLLCQIGDVEKESKTFQAGRRVMTCCIADIQFLSVRCHFQGEALPEEHAWIWLKAKGVLQADRYNQKTLCLETVKFSPARPPAQLIIGLME